MKADRFENFDKDHVFFLLDSMETAYNGGSGVHELRDAFEQYLVLSNDRKDMKLSRKEMFESLMAAMDDFENAQPQA